MSAPFPTPSRRRSTAWPYALEYLFDELSLAQIAGVETRVFASGKAEIGFARDGEWGVVAVALDADRVVSKWPLKTTECMVDLPADNPLFWMISEALERDRDDWIREKIWAEIADMRQAARDYRDELRDRVQDWARP